MDNYYKNLPKKRMGAGALILNHRKELLIVKPTYKDHWTIPGGVVEKNESPKQACLREIKEEIRIELKEANFLCMDYISENGGKSENLQFIFYGGILDEKLVKKINIDKNEIAEYKFKPINDALPLLNEKMRKRIPKCIEALERDISVYLENGM